MTESKPKLCASCGRALSPIEASVTLSDNSIACMNCIQKAIADITIQPGHRMRRTRTVEAEPRQVTDAMLEFMRWQRDFALSHGFNPDNWESGYLAKSDEERKRIESDWFALLREFTRTFRPR